MSTDKLVVIGGSAGAVGTLIAMAKQIPINFNAAICVTLHVYPHSRSVMPKILQLVGQLEALHPEDGTQLRRGHIYLAPPDWHMLLEGDTLRLSRGARENRHRPSIDVLFRSAAGSHGSRVIAVLLSGFLDDGTAGLLAIKKQGGTVIIQDPRDTEYPDMPRNAMEYVKPNFLLPATSIVEHLVQLTKVSLPFRHRSEDELQKCLQRQSNILKEVKMVKLSSGDSTEHMMGTPSTFVCPECKGTLWEIEDGTMLRFRCHEGHAYSPLSLVAGQSESLEEALWSAVRALDEKRVLASKLVQRAEQHGQTLAIEKFKTESERASLHADIIRQLLKEGQIGLKDGKKFAHNFVENEDI